MVAVVVGSRLGVEQTSGWVLGSRGQLGQSSLGRNGENVFVNAATGNLMVNRRDEFLLGQGADSTIVRSYNSLSSADGDNDDGWRMTRALSGLTGTVNTAGSTITRTDWDGAQVVYTWVSATVGYRTHEGAGAYDRLTWDGTSATWTWTDGDSQATETYADPGATGVFRITARKDTDGQGLTFEYNTDGYLSRVTTQTVNGHPEYTDFVYGTGAAKADLLELRTSYWDATSSTTKTETRTRYAYDAQHRLISVMVDLTPGDNSVADGKAYVTTYTYDGTSDRIASISQTDGSRLDITYETSGAFRVKTISQTVGAGVVRTTSFNYVNATRTDVTGPDGLVTILEYDGAGQLIRLTEPGAAAGVTPQVLELTYDAYGNVTRVKSAPNVWTDFEYLDTNGDGSDAGGTDHNGLWTRQYVRDGINGYLASSRTYSARNAVLTETRYTGYDPDGVGGTQATGGLTTRYVYDSENHLAYVVSATGSVVKYDYNPTGNLIRTISYTGAAYALTGLSEQQSPSLATMNAWVAALADKTQAQITEMVYDFRGALATSYAYSDVLATGGANGAAPRTTTQYGYDHRGRLTSRYVVGVSGVESFVYDGLDRIIASVDFSGASTASAFYDALSTTVVTNAEGLNRISVFNRAGELVSQTETTRAPNLVNLNGWPADIGSVPSGTASVNGWQNPNGMTTETQWSVVDGPDGRPVVAMLAGQSPDSNPQGGGNQTNSMQIDGSKAYEFVYYFRKSDLTRHSLYFGLSPHATQAYVEGGGGWTDNLNPYFYGVHPTAQQTTFQADRWYKVVAYVLPSGTATIPAGATGGVYDMTTGAKVASTQTFRWNDPRPDDSVFSRFFLFNDNAGAANQVNTTWFYAPEMRQVDTSATPDLTPATQYRYDNMGRLRLVVDETGAAAHTLYDRVGRKTAEIDADGSLTEYQYDLYDRPIATIRYATRVNVAALVDAAGNPLPVEVSAIRPTAHADDAWNWTVYDLAGRVVQTIDGAGASVGFTYDGAGRLTAARAYANVFNAAAIAGFKSAVARPPQTLQLPGTSAGDRVTRYFYDADGRRIGTLQADGRAPGVMTAEGYFSRVVYDQAGRVVRTDAFAEKIVDSTLLNSGAYDALLAEVQSPANAADITTWSVYDARGFLRGAVNGEGEVTLYDYNPLGQVIQVVRGRKLAAAPTSQPTLAALTAAPASPTIETTTYTRNAYGQVLTEVRALAGGTETVTYAYDALRRLVATTTDRIAGAGADYGTRQRYDVHGRLIGQLGGEGTAALLALGGSPTAAQVDAVYRQWGVTFVYDAADRLISRTDPDGVNGAGRKTLYFYDADGALAYQVNARGEVVGYAYDAQNRRTHTIAYADRIGAANLAALKGGAPAGDLLTAPYSRVAGSIPATAAVTQLVYNVTDTVKETQQRLNATETALTSFLYNAFGEATKRTDDKGAAATALTSDTTYAYDLRGLLTQMIQNAGSGQLNRTTTTVYDAFGRAVQATDPRGAVRQTQYDRAGRVLVLRDAYDKTTKYTYDARGNVLSVENREGETTLFTHDAFNRQVTMQTAEGLVATTTYDDQGHVLTLTDGGGRVTAYAYDLNGALKTTTRGSAGDGSLMVETTSYDSAGQVYETLDGAGVRTRYTYDAAGRVLTQAVDPTGRNLVTTYTYDARGQRIGMTDPTGAGVEYGFDLAGRQTYIVRNPGVLDLATVYEYDHAGNVVSVREGAGSGFERKTVYTYDKLDRRTKEQVDPDGLNLQTTYAYDLNGNVVSRTDKIDATTNAVTRYVYDLENRLTWSVDPAGGVSRTYYDAEGRVVRTLAYAKALTAAQVTGLGAAPTEAAITALITANAAQDRSTAYVYDDDGRLVFTLEAGGALSEAVYDGSGAAIRQIRYATAYVAGLTPSETELRAWVSTNAGTGDRVTRAVYDAAGRQAYGIDAAGAVTTYVYDAAGRVIRTVQHAAPHTTAGDRTIAQMAAWVSANPSAADRTTRVVYDAAGRQAYGIDAAGAVTTYVYDAAGRVIRAVQHAAPHTTAGDRTEAQMAAWVTANAGTADRTTRAVYDAAGRQTYGIDAAGAVTRSVYDAAGRVIRTVQYAVLHTTAGDRTEAQMAAWVSANAGTDDRKTHVAYDAAGRATFMTDAAGYISRTVYDGLGRVTSQSRFAPAFAVADGAGQATLAGLVAAHESTAATSVYAYDAAGRRVVSVDPLGGQTLTEFDGLGRQVKVTDPRGSIGYFYYDTAGRLTLQIDPERYATRTVYNAAGEVVGVTRHVTRVSGTLTVGVEPTITAHADDATTTIERDALGRVTRTLDAEGYSEVYVLNAFGDRTSVTNKLGGVTAYTYDARGLKLSEQVGYAAGLSIPNRFEYDAFGDLRTTIEADGLAEQRTTQYVYDRLGRLTQKTGDALTVTASVDFSTTTGVIPTETIVYDSFGNVIETQNAGGARTLFYYDALNRKVSELDAAGTLREWTYDARDNARTERVYGVALALPATPGGARPTGGSAWRETLYVYDLNNRLTHTTVADLRIGEYGTGYTSSTSTSVTVENRYDAAGNLVERIDGRGVSSFAFYDRLGRQIAQVDAEGYLTAYVRDAEGNALQEIRYAIRVTGAMSATRDPLTLAPRTADAALGDRITDFTYDQNGRRLSETRRGVEIYTAAVGDADRMVIADATIQYAYDGLGNVTRKIEANGDTFDFEYDQLGRLTEERGAQFVDYLGATVRHETVRTYNGLSAVTQVREGAEGGLLADARVSTFTYGVGGRLMTATDATGFQRHYGYDAMGRVTQERYDRVRSGATTLTEGRRYSYDVLGRLTAESAASKPASAWQFGEVRSSVYNAYGEITEKRLNGVAQETFAYDAGGRVWRSTAGDGVVRFFVHDANGAVTLTIQSAGQDLSAATLDQAIAYVSTSGVIDGGTGAGVVAAFQRYDARGMLTATIEPKRQLSQDLTTLAYTTATLTRGRTYNAFGEVVSETDARGFTTDFSYNTMGRLLEQKSPEVAYTDEHGVVAYARPTLQHRYDLSGRLIATRNANGYWTSRTLLAGSGHGENEAVVLGQLNADGGVLSYGVDVFGDIRKVTNQLGHVTENAYDKAGRLIEVKHPKRLAGTPGNPGATDIQLVDHYDYDGLGQRIGHWNSQFGSSVLERTRYDLEGRVVSQIDFEGREVQYAYAWNATLSTGALGVLGGYVRTTSHLATGKTGTETFDSFGRLTAKTDLGGHAFAMGFDAAGRQTTQTSNIGQSLTWSWFNTGLMASQADVSGNAVTYSSSNTRGDFGYDANGNRVSERYVATNWTWLYDPALEWDPGTAPTTSPSVVQTTTVRQDGRATYDALGRMTEFQDLVVSTTDPTKVTYTYDLNGNVRSTAARYWTTSGGLITVGATSWYKYDAMDRFVIAGGQLTGSEIVGGQRLLYDAAGNRRALYSDMEVTTDNVIDSYWEYRPGGVLAEPEEPWDGQGTPPDGYVQVFVYEKVAGTRIEQYDYTPDGYLAQVSLSLGEWNTSTDTVVQGASAVYARDQRDAMGRLVSHKEYALGGTVVSHERTAVYDKTGLIQSEVTQTLSDYLGGTSQDYVTTVTTNYDYRLETTPGSGNWTGQWMGAVTRVRSSSTWTKGGDAPPPTQTTYAYTWWDDARQAKITHDTNTGDGGDIFTSTFGYDLNGKLSHVNIKDGRPRNVTFVTDMNGQVLDRRETAGDPVTAPWDRYYYFNGVRVGEISNHEGFVPGNYVAEVNNRTTPPPSSTPPYAFHGGWSADFDQAYEALTPGSVRGNAVNWTVRDGDTLQRIAAAVWGDASLWYLIAEANGLTSASLLSAGQSLLVPARQTNAHNNTDTFKPYDPNAALGDVNPTQPKPPAKPGGCGVVGQIIAVVIAIAVSYFTAGALAGLAGQGLLGAFAAGAISGAAGALASQGFLIATGAQDSFNWKSIAISALSAGISKGLGEIGGFTDFVSQLAGGNEHIQAALMSMSGNALTQSVAKAVGLQEKFSWTDVAVAGVSAAAGSWLAGELGVPSLDPKDPNFKAPKDWNLKDWGASLASNIGVGAAGAATRTALGDGSFGDNFVASLPNAIGQTLGNAIVGQIQADDYRRAMKAAEELRERVAAGDQLGESARADVLNNHARDDAQRANLSNAALPTLVIENDLRNADGERANARFDFDDNVIAFDVDLVAGATNPAGAAKLLLAALEEYYQWAADNAGVSFDTAANRADEGALLAMYDVRALLTDMVEADLGGLNFSLGFGDDIREFSTDAGSLVGAYRETFTLERIFADVHDAAGSYQLANRPADPRPSWMPRSTFEFTLPRPEPEPTFEEFVRSLAGAAATTSPVDGNSPSDDNSASIRFQHEPGLDLPPNLVARINRVYDDIGGGFYVTSGRRGAGRQATAMYNNYRQRDGGPTYRNAAAAAQVRAAYTDGIARGLPRAEVIANMQAVLQNQMDNGIYLSRHQTDRAMDISLLPAGSPVVAAIRAHPTVQSIQREDDHWHIQFK